MNQDKAPYVEETEKRLQEFYKLCEEYWEKMEVYNNKKRVCFRNILISVKLLINACFLSSYFSKLIDLRKLQLQGWEIHNGQVRDITYGSDSGFV